MSASQEYQVIEWENTHCPICYADNGIFYERFGYNLKFTYLLCCECRTVYQNPRPQYNTSFVEEAYEDYATNRWNYKDATYYERNAIQFDKELKEILGFDKRKTAILDVGPGVGLFLYSARKFYPEYMGLEVSKNLARIIEEQLHIKIHTDPFESFAPGRKFSCINISHVIEHVPNPNEWMQKAKSLLEPEGLLVIDVPNWFAWTQKLKWFLKRLGIRKGEWPAGKMPEHLYEPTYPGMHRLFSQNGFYIVKYYTYSRRDLVSEKQPMAIYHRFFKAGSNFRFYLKANP